PALAVVHECVDVTEVIGKSDHDVVEQVVPGCVGQILVDEMERPVGSPLGYAERDRGQRDRAAEAHLGQARGDDNVELAWVEVTEFGEVFVDPRGWYALWDVLGAEAYRARRRLTALDRVGLDAGSGDDVFGTDFRPEGGVEAG